MEKPPKDYETAATLMIVSGALNAAMSFVAFLSLACICIGFFYLLPLVVGVLEIVIGASMLQGQPRPSARSTSILGLIAAALTFNVISVICEAVALSMLNKPEVTRYLEGPTPGTE